MTWTNFYTDLANVHIILIFYYTKQMLQGRGNKCCHLLASMVGGDAISLVEGWNGRRHSFFKGMRLFLYKGLL